MLPPLFTHAGEMAGILRGHVRLRNLRTRPAGTPSCTARGKAVGGRRVRSPCTCRAARRRRAESGRSGTLDPWPSRWLRRTTAHPPSRWSTLLGEEDSHEAHHDPRLLDLRRDLATWWRACHHGCLPEAAKGRQHSFSECTHWSIRKWLSTSKRSLRLGPHIEGHASATTNSSSWG